MTVQFRTTEFVMSHGHEPRGYGHWAFFFHPARKEAWWCEGMFSDAKKEARKEARKRGVEEVFVGS